MNFDAVKAVARTKAFAVTLAGMGGAALGAATAYTVLNKQLEKKYSELADREIEAARDSYARRYKADNYKDLLDYATKDVKESEEVFTPRDPEVRAEDIRDAAQQIAEQHSYVPYNKMFGETPTVQPEQERIEVVASQRTSVWDTQPIIETEEFDAAKEAEKRDQGLPYIVDNVTFYENDQNRVQYTFQYFEDDDVLVDENQSPIDKVVIERNLGAGNLRFGYGSGHKHTVLIHNPVSDVQYEVIRDPSSYTKEILGIDPYEEEDHSPRRFRNDE